MRHKFIGFRVIACLLMLVQASLPHIAVVAANSDADDSNTTILTLNNPSTSEEDPNTQLVTCVDADDDGICAENDCNDNDPLPYPSQDTDNDTICDDVDWCIDEPGPSDNFGCPYPDACTDHGGDADEDGICADTDCDDADASNTDESPNCNDVVEIDPMTKIGCVPADEFFDTNNLQSISDFSCGETVKCGVWFTNEGGDVDSIAFNGSVNINGGTVQHSATATTSDISCSQSGGGYSCNGVLPAGQAEDIIVEITLDQCGCNETSSASISASMSVDNDSNSANNSDSQTITGEGESCGGGDKLACTATSVSPSNIVVGDDSFAVTCRGEDVAYFTVTARNSLGQLVASSGNLQDSNNDDKETWNYTPTQEGEYTFTCKAFGNGDSETCPADSGTADEQIDECVDPITSLTVTSHTNNEAVTQNNTTLYGFVAGDVDEVLVNSVPAQLFAINGGHNWSLTVSLDEGYNTFNIVAKAGDTDCADKTTSITIYHPETQEETTTCDATRVTPQTIQLGDGSVQITCEGVNVDKFNVYVENAAGTKIFTDSAMGSDTASWNWTPSAQGSFDVYCDAWGPNQSDDVCPIKTVIVTKRTACEAPITDLSITSHTANEEVNSRNVTLYGTVTGGVYKVTVNGTDAQMFQTATGEYNWSLNVQISGDSKEFTVKAYAVDDDCDYIKKNITLYYVDKDVVCEDLDVSPTTVRVDNGIFTATCRGDDISKAVISVTNSNGIQVTSSGDLLDTNDDNTETWTWEPGQTGAYTFHCTVYGELSNAVGNVDACNPVDVTVTTVTNKCIDPIGELKIASHTNNEVVDTQVVTLYGTVTGGVDEVRVNGTQAQLFAINPTTTNWSLTVTVDEGTNSYNVVAYPKDDDCSIVTKSIKLIYKVQGKTTCEETDVSPTTVVLGTNGSFDVTCRGTNIDSYRVVVRDDQGFQVAQSQILQDTNDNDTETWSWTPTQEGEYAIQCESWGTYSDPKCPETPVWVRKKDDPKKSLCLATTLTETQVTYGEEDFEVTCSGENITSYRVIVSDITGQNIIATSPLLQDTDNNDIETWQWTPTAHGQYRFQCESWGTYGDPVCPYTVGETIKNNNKKSDPAIEIVCDDAEMLTCGGKVSCTATLSNTAIADITAEDFMAKIDAIAGSELIPGSEVIATIYPGNTMSCGFYYENDLTPDTNLVMSCNGTIQKGTSVTVGFELASPTCACEQQYTTTVAGEVSASNGDKNLLNNTDSDSVIVKSDKTCGGGNKCDLSEQIDAVSIVNYDDEEIVEASMITIQALVSPEQNVKNVTINGTIATKVGNFYEAKVNLSVGENTISVVATPLEDLCAPMTEIIRVTRKVQEVCEFPITLTIDEPENGEETRNRAITVRGTVNDNADEVKVKGVVVTIASDNTFETIVDLLPGNNTINVVATNEYPDCKVSKSVVVEREFTSRGGSGRRSSITCGNGLIDGVGYYAEECDDGNSYSGDGCSSTCKIEEIRECGNGIVEVGETCDDGNRRSGDGCSATCEIEEIVIPVIEKKTRIVRRIEPLVLPAVPVELPRTGDDQLNRLFRPELELDI